jgi:A/G-specific adenine glycosylase
MNSCSFLNQSLMELGALICTPRNPQCGVCPVKKLCVAFRENRVDELPNLGKREAATARHFVALVAGRNELRDVKPLCTIKHSITRYRITLEAYRVNLGRTSCTSPHSKPAKSGARVTHPSKIGVWRTPEQLHQLAFSSAHKQILNQLPATLK